MGGGRRRSGGVVEGGVDFDGLRGGTRYLSGFSADDVILWNVVRAGQERAAETGAGSVISWLRQG